MHLNNPDRLASVGDSGGPKAAQNPIQLKHYGSRGATDPKELGLSPCSGRTLYRPSRFLPPHTTETRKSRVVQHAWSMSYR